MSDKTNEKSFQNDILNSLLSKGWKLGNPDLYDRERALIPEDLLGFVKETHEQDWEKHLSLSRNDPEEGFLNKIVDIASKTLKSSEPSQEKHYGTLGLLRQKFSCNGGNFNLVQFLPDHDLNEKTVRDYGKNRFTVIPELTYSPHIGKGVESSKRYRIDFVFFINGIPIATMELKSEFKQDIQDAIKQSNGDVAGVFFSGERGEKILSILQEYIHLELSFRKE
jgi:type I restriction enzyme R subunit